MLLESIVAQQQYFGHYEWFVVQVLDQLSFGDIGSGEAEWVNVVVDVSVAGVDVLVPDGVWFGWPPLDVYIYPLMLPLLPCGWPPVILCHNR